MTAVPTRRRRWGRNVLLVLVGFLLLLALYTWLALHWDYSTGYRSGTMQKFSRRGWVCKTYEGELWQSVVMSHGTGFTPCTRRSGLKSPSSRRPFARAAPFVLASAGATPFDAAASVPPTGQHRKSTSTK